MALFVCPICGGGYYTADVAQALREAGRPAEIAGVDLSKFALRRAAKRVKEARFAVASVYHLPAASGAADLVINCFSRPFYLSCRWF